MKKNTFFILLLIMIFSTIIGVYFYIPKNSKTIIDLLVAEKDIATLTRDSQEIVIGSVREVRKSQKGINKYTADDVVFTDFVITVEKKIKGFKSESIIVRLPGGTVEEGRNKHTVFVSDVPEFVKGERVLLFLSKSTDGFFYLPDEYYTIEGWFQGKYQIINGNAINPRREITLDQLRNEIDNALK